MDCYNGLNAKEPVSEDNDFYFEYIDIPSYFEINKDSVKFVVEDRLEIDEVFEDNSFKKLDIF